MGAPSTKTCDTSATTETYHTSTNFGRRRRWPSYSCSAIGDSSRQIPAEYYVGRYGQIPQWEKPRIVKDYELWLAHVTRTHLGINYVEIKKRQLEWAVIDADAAAAPPVYPIHDSSAYIATATAAAELFLL